MLRMAGPLAVRLTDRIVKMLIDLSFLLVVLVTVLSLSQTTSDAHAQWRRLRKPPANAEPAGTIKVKRQIPPSGNMMSPGGGGMQGSMGGMMASSGGGMMSPSGGMMMNSGPPGAPPGGPQFMGPPGIQHEFSCIGRLPRLYQDPWMCTRYYWCNYGSPPVPFTCPNGQLFDQELQTCTAAMAVECRDFPEPLDALDMPAGGIGYHGGPHGAYGMNTSPYASMPVPSGGGPGPMVASGSINVPPMPPPGAPSPTNAAIMPPVPAASNPNSGLPMPLPGASNGLNGLTGNAAQPASLQAGNTLSGNINLNQFAQAILSANSANKVQQAFLRSTANADTHNTQMAMPNGTPDMTGACDGAKAGMLMADVARNCRNYYFCSQDGMKFEFPCPAGMLFSDQLRSCTSPDQVICVDSHAFGSNSNQVLNGFAAANAARNNLGYGGVMSSQGEPVALRYPQMNGVSTNAIYSLPSGKRQAVAGLPDFTPMFTGYPTTQVQQTNTYNPYAMTRQAVVTQPQMGGATGSTSPTMYNPYVVTQMGSGMYGAQMPHHVTQRSMHTSNGNTAPQYGNPYQAADPNQYPGQAPAYPHSYHHRQSTAVAGEGATRSMSAEPQIEGSPSYPQMPNYNYQSGQGMGQPAYQGGGMVPGQGGGYPGPHHGHSIQMGMGAGGRNRPRMPIDPEAEVEAGRAHETPPAGATGGTGQGIPAGLSAPGGHQSPVGPMIMDPESSIPSAVPSPSVREGAMNMSGLAQVIIDRPDVMATSVTIRPMTPDIILRVHLDNTSFPLLSSHNPAETAANAVYTVRRNHSAKHVDNSYSNMVFSIPENGEFTVPPR